MIWIAVWIRSNNNRAPADHRWGNQWFSGCSNNNNQWSLQCQCLKWILYSVKYKVIKLKSPFWLDRWRPRHSCARVWLVHLFRRSLTVLLRAAPLKAAQHLNGNPASTVSKTHALFVFTCCYGDGVVRRWAKQSGRAAVTERYLTYSSPAPYITRV